MANKQILQVIIEGKDLASATLKNFNKTLGKTSIVSAETAKNLKRIGVVAGGLAIGLGVKAVQAAVKFNKSMSNVSTLVDTATEDMEKMKEEVIEMSKRMPVALDDLSAALYDVRSAGISAANAMDVLETAAMLGVAGLGTTKEAANLLTTAINAFGLQSRDAKEVADVLFKTVKAGKTDIAKLSEAFGKMAGNAKAAKISFEDTQAATAALTALTGKTSEAQNALAQVFLELTVTGGKLDKGLKENKFSLEKLNEAIGEKGLVGGMKIAMETMGLTEVEFKNLFSSAEGGTVVYQLLTDAYNSNKKALEDMTTGADELTTAFEKQNKEAAALWERLKNNLNIELIKLGNEILPNLITGVENGILILREWKDWWDEIVDVLGTVIFNLMKVEELVNKVKRIGVGVMSFGLTEVFGIGEKITGSRATGGPVQPGKSFLVGERGPEVFTPAVSGRIIPGGAGNITINITGNMLLDRDAGDLIGEQIMDRLRLNIRI